MVNPTMFFEITADDEPLGRFSFEKNPSHWLGGVPASLAPAGLSHYKLYWNRCCVLLTGDPKILGVLEHLGSGESSGDRGTVCGVCTQGLDQLFLIFIR
uniref:Uncharacterized protein n=1 Tax=Mus spicilegus TaxID=10103 RepID=A0A8C6HAR6_MUSSI